MERLARFVLVCACVFYFACCHASNQDTIKLLKTFQSKMNLLEMLSRLPKLTQVNSSKCFEDVIYVYDSLMLRKLWAIKMLDASSKLQSGVLEGNLVDLGHYDECVDILQSDTNSTFQGQHCLVDISTPLEGTGLTINSSTLQAVMPGSLSVTMSLCLPSSCSSNEVKQLYQMLFATVESTLEALLQMLNISIPPELMNLTVTSEMSNCHIKAETSLSSSELFALWVFIFLLIIVVLSTAYEYIHTTYFSEEGTTVRHEVISCFSLRVNTRRLFSGGSSAETMSVINGLKVISIAWVVLGHRCRYSAQFPISNLLRMTDYVKVWYSMIILNGTLSVDVFFVIGGLLNAYYFLNVGSRRRKPLGSCAMNYVHRYLRLTPAYALMILMTATWVYRVGDGPIWDWLAGKAKQDCAANGWSNLLYINNYYSPDNNCMMQSWYLAADMQMFWLSPLLLYPLLKWPVYGIVEGAVLCVLSIFVPFYVAYANDIATPVPLTKDQERVNREMDALYIPTHTKTVSYVIGILTGYLIHRIRHEKMNFGINKITVSLAWLATVLCLVGSLFGCYWIYQFDHPYNKWESSLYIGFYRFFWSAGIAWILLSCTTGHGGIVNKFLSLRMFTVLGRLTYCIYLVHVAVIMYDIGSLRQPQYFTLYGQVCLFFGDFAISVILAIILNLTLESPLMALDKIIFRRHSARQKHESR